MGTRTPNLQLRGNIYRFRLRVPDALRELVGKAEIVRSLGTGDFKKASQLARIERVKVEREWNLLQSQHPMPMSENDILQLVSRWLMSEDLRPLPPPEDYSTQTARENYDEAMQELAATMNWDVIAPTLYQTAERLIAEAKLAIVPDDPLFLRLQEMLQRAMSEVERRRIIRQFPRARVPLDPFFVEVPEQAVVQPVAKKSLAALIQDMQKDPARLPLRGKTLLKRQAQWRILECFFGTDTDVAIISREDVRRFMEFLRDYPSNASKHFPRVAPLDVPALAKARNLPTMSVDTANDYLRQLGALTRYALNEGIIKNDPAAGLLFKPAKAVAAKDKRLPFSDDDLNSIFSAPLYRGCLNDEGGYAQIGPKTERRGRFWVPLISLFTGMRLNEICQLTLNDFVLDDETDVILIRGTDDDTKRVKTEAGQRFVPVHPELKALGLLRDVQMKKRKRPDDAALFGELPLGSTGYRSDPFSKFFARFLNHLDITHPKKVFHSFRHNYRDALREADISAERVRALGGWTSGRTEEAYGAGLRPKTLASEIEKIKYPRLDLSALYQPLRSR